MGGLLGPADGLYHDLGCELRGRTASARCASATASRTTSRAACTTSPRPPISRAARARAGSSSIGHSFGGAVAVQAGVVLGEHCRGVVTLVDAVGRLRGRRPSSATRRCCCCTAPTTRSCRRRRAASCRCSPVTARSCCSPAPATCSRRPRPSSASACRTWIPERFASASATARQVPASLATIGANSSTLSSPTTT